MDCKSGDNGRDEQVWVRVRQSGGLASMVQVWLR